MQGLPAVVGVPSGAGVPGPPPSCVAGTRVVGHGGGMSQSPSDERDQDDVRQHPTDQGGNGTAEPRSHLVEDDQEQPEDASYEGGAGDRTQPPQD